jgi:CHAD domain-containing protein
MAFRLPFDRDLNDSIRETAREELTEAIRLLRDDYGDDPVTAVHEARKNLKKTRALLRLARPGLDAAVYRRENDAIRDAARLISGARDADVMLQTVDRLAKRDDPRVSPSEFAELRWLLREPALAGSGEAGSGDAGPGDAGSGDAGSGDAGSGDAGSGDERDAGGGVAGSRDGAEPAPQGDAVSAVIAALGAVVERIDDWETECDWAAIGRGASRAYRAGRAAFVEADIDPTTERLHDWRKRVKDLWYHQRLLSEAWPEVLGVLAEEAHGLSELLGDDHDLGVLAEWIAGDRGGRGDAIRQDAILDLIAESRVEQLRDARRLARRVYAETAAAFTTRTQVYLSCAEAEAARDASV